jgi:hypothetical protein
MTRYFSANHSTLKKQMDTNLALVGADMRINPLFRLVSSDTAGVLNCFLTISSNKYKSVNNIFLSSVVEEE